MGDKVAARIYPSESRSEKENSTMPRIETPRSMDVTGDQYASLGTLSPCSYVRRQNYFVIFLGPRNSGFALPRHTRLTSTWLQECGVEAPARCQDAFGYADEPGHHD